MPFELPFQQYVEQLLHVALRQLLFLQGRLDRQRFQHVTGFLLVHQLLLVVERKHVGRLRQLSVPFGTQQRFEQPELLGLGLRLPYRLHHHVQRLQRRREPC